MKVPPEHQHHDTPAPDSVRLIGARIGNFRIESILGRGGMGTVYTATHHTLARKAAIKVLEAALAEDRVLVDRFIDEARVVSGLGHPGLVQIFDFGRLPSGQFYSIMEHLEGRDLERTIGDGGPMAPEQVASIGTQVAAAAAVAHDRGIVHRDLKPANIFLATDSEGGERVVLLDFGIAKLLDGSRARTTETARGQIVGTPEYMAPEQARGTAPVDARVDVYALGCVLYELLSGRPPFRSESITELLIAHVQEPPRPITEHCPKLPEALARAVMRCLEKDPSARFSSMREVRDALLPLASELPASTSPARRSSDLDGRAKPAPRDTARAGDSIGLAHTAHAHQTDESLALARTSYAHQTAETLPPLQRRRVMVWAGAGLATALAIAGGLSIASSRQAISDQVDAGRPATPTAEHVGQNPYSPSDPLAVAEGAAIWRSMCVDCHGERGEGDGERTPPGLEPKVFSDTHTAPGTLDRYRFEIVRRGVAVGDDYTMPPFSHELSADETWKVVTFIATLAADPPERSAVEPGGPVPDLSEPARLRRGETLFQQRCSSCHGDEGGGDGHAARFLNRRPSDLTSGIYKLRSTLDGSIPLDEDIYRTLTAGMRMVGMPSFAALSEDDRWALVAHLKTLSDRFSTETPTPQIQIPPRPPMNESSIADGHTYFTMAGCQTCHGEEGRGDGPEADTLVDDRGDSLEPPDFALPGMFIGGASPEDIYRTMMTGIDGTPMWAGRDFFSPEQGWDVVHFILSVGQSPERAADDVVPLRQ